MFLQFDARWHNLRTYLINICTIEGETFIAGLALSVVLPFMFWIQNILLGICFDYCYGQGSTIAQIILRRDQKKSFFGTVFRRTLKLAPFQSVVTMNHSDILGEDQIYKEE